jgi:beta-lactamase regulating signal transducer with metallopeptidase domain
MLGALWLLGTAVLLGGLAVGLSATARLAARLADFSDDAVSELVAGLAAHLRIRRPVRVIRGDPGTMPMSWGWLRPVLLLPDGAERWSRARLNAVILHELAHVRRSDCLTQVIAEVAVALHWPNPWVWLAARRLRVEREYACDDLVLTSGARASVYADELIALARSFRAKPELEAAAVAMARPTTLVGRLR